MSASAIEETATTSFSSVQMMLLSVDAPRTISRAALSMSAVSSTTTGGLPGPAQIARFPLFMAAFTTSPPPVTTTSRTPECFISSCAGDRFVEKNDRLHAAVFRVRMDVEDDAVPGREHSDRIADDRGSRIGDRRDRADDSERRRLDESQTMVAGRGDRSQVFDSRR